MDKQTHAPGDNPPLGLVKLQVQAEPTPDAVADFWAGEDYVAALLEEAPGFFELVALALFLAAVIQAGGLPRRFPRPLASLSKVMIASSICSRSWRSSASILATSIISPPKGTFPNFGLCSENGTVHMI